MDLSPNMLYTQLLSIGLGVETIKTNTFTVALGPQRGRFLAKIVTPKLSNAKSNIREYYSVQFVSTPIQHTSFADPIRSMSLEAG